MLDIKYAYFLGCLYFLAIWIFLFWRLKQYRKLMIFMSFLLSPLGLFFEYFLWTKDWWHPLNMTGTKIGIEDFLLSFTQIVLPTPLYVYVFEKEVKEFDFSKEIFIKGLKNLVILTPFSLFFTLFIFYFLKLNSFIATISGVFLGIFFIFLKRKDLIKHSFLAGFLFVFYVITCYVMGIFLYPNIISEFWYIDKISNILFLGIPVEDLLFYLGVGMFLGVMYPYLFDFKIDNSVKTNSLSKDLKRFFLLFKNNFLK